jgi:tRNA pseudouridine13 synthase
MYKIKEKPDDFIVKEVSDLKLKELGKYAVCILKKKNYTTMRAVSQIANALMIKAKDIGFAGIKDKSAVTEQFISVKSVDKGRLIKFKLKDISLEFKGYSNNPISLGDLKENEFIITVKAIDTKKIKKLEKNKKFLMPNLFGEQRFSKNNVAIGKLLLKGDFKNALNLILKTNPDCKDEIKKSIKKNLNDFVGALKLMPKKLLILYVHAYQSYLWNICLEEYVKTNTKNIEIPLIGFGTEDMDKKVEKIIEDIMEKENVSFRSFINRSMPDISLEGGLRNAFIEIKNFEILEKGKDFVKIKFRLSKGSYATEAVKFLF